MVNSSREDFLSRWSSRKQKAREETELDSPAEGEDAQLSEAAPVVDGDGASEAAALSPEPEKTDEDILQELGLPDPESLMKGDSIAGFLKAGVPMRLRNRALRRLWLTDPIFANLDGLNDYEEDFTDAATVVKGMRTAYRPGRGFLRDDPAPEALDADTGSATEITTEEELAAPGEVPLDEAEGAVSEQTGAADHVAGEDLAGSASARGGAVSPENADHADLPEDESEDNAGAEDNAVTGCRPEAAEPEQAGDKNDNLDDDSDATDQGISESVVFPRRMQFHFDTG